jgi:hypothetical protein
MAKSTFLVHPDPKIAAAVLGGGKKDPPAEPPQNYKPSTPDQRNRWNKFLDFMQSKGMAGNVDLDKRDRSLGMDLLNEYNKKNPSMAVAPDFIPIAQHESNLIRKQQTFPGLMPDQSRYAFSKLAPQFLNRPISPVDNWLGSYTSKQYYPTFTNEGDKTGAGKISYGTDFESYAKSGMAGQSNLKQVAPGIAFRQ